jgi:branched-chain amino acid transport system substrate-binding protein
MKLSLSMLSGLALLLAGCTVPPAPTVPTKHLPKPPGLMAEIPESPNKGLIPTTAVPVKVALLLPLSGDSAAVGNAMLDAATMALSDSYFTAPSDSIHSQIILLPKDTGNTPAEAIKSAQEAIQQGATFIVGPLFSQSATAIAPIAREHNVRLLTFSNNSAVAGNGVYLFGFMPEQQVVRMAEYAYLHNLQRVAALVPNDAYGQKVKDTLVATYTQKGGIVSPAELYAPSPANIDAAVGRLAAAYNNNTEDRRFQAIFVADGGAQLKNIIESMKRNHIDMKKVKLLGTGLWDDPAIAKMPEMQGAWFPSSPPAPYAIFENRFVSTYGYKPVRLASLAYDALTFTAAITMPNDGLITDMSLTAPQGFNGPANGVFRLKADGTVQRKLDVMEVTPEGFKVLDVAPPTF